VQYALLVYTDPDSFDDLTEEQRRAVTDEAWALRDDPRMVGGARLQPARFATTVRVEDEQTLVSDGPFADTKEVFGGFYLLEADDLDAAIELAARIPSARLGGSVEIRPILEDRP
jgi:hypothetical protein